MRPPWQHTVGLLLLLFLTLACSPHLASPAAAASKQRLVSAKAPGPSKSPPKTRSSSSTGAASKLPQGPPRTRLQEVQRATPPSLIAVIGERHSGTNFMWRLLRTNLAESVNVTDTFCDYKHRYQWPGKHCPDLGKTLVVVMFRNPFDWALAMHERCWCGSDEQANITRTLDLDKFLTMPWHDTTRRKAEIAAGPPGWVPGLSPGDPNATERDDTGLVTCSNLLQCRAKKYLNFLNISHWAQHVVYVRHEDVITPTLSIKWLSALIKRYSLPQLNVTLQPIELYKRRKALKFNVEVAKVKSLWFNPGVVTRAPQLQQFARHVARLADASVESKLGYPLQRRQQQR